MDTECVRLLFTSAHPNQPVIWRAALYVQQVKLKFRINTELGHLLHLRSDLISYASEREGARLCQIHTAGRSRSGTRATGHMYLYRGLR